MTRDDKRNILDVGPPKTPGEPELTQAMVDAVRQRIEDAGSTLDFWAVLHEDTYESKFGDGFYLHLHGVALNREDAQRLADLTGNIEALGHRHRERLRRKLQRFTVRTVIRARPMPKIDDITVESALHQHPNALAERHRIVFRSGERRVGYIFPVFRHVMRPFKNIEPPQSTGTV
jgi:hypothetical protein